MCIVTLMHNYFSKIERCNNSQIVCAENHIINYRITLRNGCRPMKLKTWLMLLVQTSTMKHIISSRLLKHSVNWDTKYLFESLFNVVVFFSVLFLTLHWVRFLSENIKIIWTLQAFERKILICETWLFYFWMKYVHKIKPLSRARTGEMVNSFFLLSTKTKSVNQNVI